MYYNRSPPHQQQENTMNLLISPFEPDEYHLQYGSNNSNNNSNNNNGFEYRNNTAQPLDVPMPQSNNNHHHGLDIFDTTSIMSPVAMPKNGLYNNQSPSPQLDMMNNFANDFISRSPESSSSIESNLVSPPQQYYPSATAAAPANSNMVVGSAGAIYYSADYSTSSDSLGGVNDSSISQYNHHPAARRSVSVPPHFHKFKPNHQDSMYNQFQATTSLLHQQHLPATAMPAPKPLPIQIQRVNQNNTQSNRPANTEAHRRQLDEKLEKVNFDDITVAELKDMLRERGLSATGRKAELMNRLKKEHELLRRGGGAAAVAAAVPSGQGSPMMGNSPLHRRVANLNIMDSSSSPVQKNRQQRHYFPYSPPPTSARLPTNTDQRLASSVPDSHTPSYLNDQFMMKKKPASCLRNSVDDDEEQSRDWLHSYSVSPTSSSSFYHLSVPKIEEASNEFVVSAPSAPSTDIWDDQTLQSFLNQI